MRLPKSFAALAGLVFALITLITYFPTLLGKIRSGSLFLVIANIYNGETKSAGHKLPLA